MPSEDTPETSPPPPTEPIVSLPGRTAFTLPLMAIAVQIGIGFAVGLIGVVTGWRDLMSSAISLSIIMLLASVCYVIIVGHMLQRRNWDWADLGLNDSPNLPVLVAITGGLVTCVLASLFQRALLGPGASPFDTLSGFAFAAVILVIGIVVPIAEEIVFRGIVFPVLRAKLGDVSGAIFLSALIFAVFHIYPAQVVTALFIGLPLAWLRHWSGSLIPPIAMHMTHNIGAVLLAAMGII